MHRHRSQYSFWQEFIFVIWVSSSAPVRACWFRNDPHTQKQNHSEAIFRFHTQSTQHECFRTICVVMSVLLDPTCPPKTHQAHPLVKVRLTKSSSMLVMNFTGRKIPRRTTCEGLGVCGWARGVSRFCCCFVFRKNPAGCSQHRHSAGQLNWTSSKQ